MGEFRHGNIAKFELPEEIKNGILLHRQIDSYTDQDEYARQISQYFRKDFGRYAGIMSDICLDYFFARDPVLFPDQQSLEEFSADCYGYLQENIAYFLPEERQFIHAMSSQDWLSQYSDLSGMAKSFSNLIARSKYMSDQAKLEAALESIVENEAEIEPLYREFRKGLAAFFPTALLLQR